MAKSVTIRMPMPFIRQAGLACLHSMPSGHSCGFGPRCTAKIAAGACKTTSQSLMKFRAWMRWPNAWRNSNKSWLQYSPLLIRTRWSANHGSVDYFDLRGICTGHFKIFRIPVNQWTLATATLGGVFIVAGLILLMNYNHPYTFTAQKRLFLFQSRRR